MSTDRRQPGDADPLAVVALPAGCRLEAAADVKTRNDGHILIGGAPLTFLRLSDSGAAAVQHWFAGAPVSQSDSHQALARRLIRVGMAHPRPASPTNPLADLTVIIPVKDDRVGLMATLSHLCGPPEEQPEHQPADRDQPGHGPSSIIIVDDGSASPVSVPYQQASVVRNPWPSGPAAARQRGLAKVQTPLVAFVDAGVHISFQELQTLAEAMTDPVVVAAAPRVMSSEADHAVGRYDRQRSPLDMGPAESLVGPGRLVPYVPTACLIVRADSVETVGGFDPLLRYGEDVDLVWRLSSIGQVRYIPQVVATHPPRSTLAAMIKQRRSYGSAAAPLAARHGGSVAPCSLSPWSFLVGALAAIGRPVTASAVAAGTGIALRPKISPLPDVTVEALQLSARGHWYGSLSLLTALVRTWAPLAALGMVLMPSQRKRLVTLMLAAFARRLLSGPKTPQEAVLDLGMGAIDDLSYCAGVWEGAIRSRSAKALLPALNSWPKPESRPKRPAD